MFQRYSLLAKDNSVYYGGVGTYGAVQPELQAQSLYITNKVFLKQTTVVYVLPLNILSPTVTGLVKSRQF